MTGLIAGFGQDLVLVFPVIFEFRRNLVNCDAREREELLLRPSQHSHTVTLIHNERPKRSRLLSCAHKHNTLFLLRVQIACERLLNFRVEMKVAGKRIGDVLNRIHIAMPKTR